MASKVKKLARARRKEQRHRERRLSRERSGWVRLRCQAVCGCCEAELWYRSMSSAQAAVARADCKHATLTDDKGNTHAVDGFYGFEVKEF